MGRFEKSHTAAIFWKFLFAHLNIIYKPKNKTLRVLSCNNKCCLLTSKIFPIRLIFSVLLIKLISFHMMWSHLADVSTSNII